MRQWVWLPLISFGLVEKFVIILGDWVFTSWPQYCILPLPLNAWHTSDLKENRAMFLRGLVLLQTFKLRVTSQNPSLKMGLILYAPNFLLEKRERRLSRH